ncbi:MAG TPA: Xaa-Pro peptidase family protein [Ktedonobacterales bacterium]|nr:Xaa-Pro peptidase family protein [Ktedonobacterales bacterium]
MAQADYGRRLAETRARMAHEGLDGLLVASQYNRRYLTGFTPEDGDITESAGLALVTAERLFLITGTFSLNGIEHEIVPSGAQPLLTDKTTAGKLLAQAAQEQSIRRLGFEKDWISVGRFERLRGQVGDAVAEWVALDDIVEHVRATKDVAEVEAIRRAAAVAESAFAQLVAEIRPGMTERQVAQRLEDLMRAGASEPSFDTIVASGPGGALPHWVPSDRPIQAGEPLLIDFGARVDGYCSDITRTLVLGEPDAKLREVYAVVRAMQDAGERALREGAQRGRDVDQAARAVAEQAGYGEQYLHSLGHGVGMAVHELPALAWPRVQDPQIDAELAKVEGIEPGQIVTIEPGIYIAGWGGVRLEDLALVTPDGLELLVSRNPEQILQVG